MKKILSVILCLTFLLVGCGSSNEKEKEESNPKEEQVIEDLLSFNIQSVEFTRRIDPPITSSFYSYYTVSETLNTFIVVNVTMKNLSEESISPKDIIDSTFTIDDEDYTGSVIVVKADGTSIASSDPIEPNQELNLLIYTEISDKPDSFKLTMNINKQEGEETEVEEKIFTINVADFTAEKTYKNYGDTIANGEGVSVTVDSLIATKSLLPSNPGTIYYYYDVEDQANSFVTLKLTVKNETAESIDLAKTIGVRLIVDDVSYDGYVISEYSSGSNLSTSYSLESGEETVVYCAVEISDEKLEADSEFKLYLFGQYYYISNP